MKGSPVRVRASALLESRESERLFFLAVDFCAAASGLVRELWPGPPVSLGLMLRYLPV
jgi:hypothetical protein